MTSTRWLSAYIGIAVVAALIAPSATRAGNAGDLDPDFDADGWLAVAAGDQTIDRATGIALQADGRVVVAGYAQTGAGLTSVVLRVTAAGALDQSFAGDGIVHSAVSGNASAADVVVQPDGRLLVAGYDGAAAVLLRYLPDGSLDTSFDGDGRAILAVPGAFVATALALQPDGRIVVVGSVYNGSDSDFAIVRRNADGSADPTFDGDGLAVTPVSPAQNDVANDVVVQPDGRIVVAGRGNIAAAVVRYLADGTLDSGFAGDGIADGGPGVYDGRRVALQPDGRIVVAAQAIPGADVDLAAVRYDAAGNLDGTFGSGGVAIVGVRTASADIAGGIAVQADGAIVLAGWSDYALADPDGARVLLVRLTPDGALDQSFDGDGRVVSDFGDVDLVGDVALQADGRIIVATAGDRGAGDDIVVARYLAAGPLPCTALPAAGCLTATRATLLLAAADEDRKDKLLWKAADAGALTQAMLADPTASADFALCLYAGPGSTLIGDAWLPAGSRWRELGSGGYAFKGASPDGLGSVKVRGETARALARGKGAALPDPPLPLDGVVTVQLQKVGEPLCIESAFPAAAQRRNSSTQFKATLP